MGHAGCSFHGWPDFAIVFQACTDFSVLPLPVFLSAIRLLDSAAADDRQQISLEEDQEHDGFADRFCQKQGQISEHRQMELYTSHHISVFDRQDVIVLVGIPFRDEGFVFLIIRDDPVGDRNAV